MKQDERKALIGKYILLILGSVLILVPLLATLFSSFKPTKDIVDNFFGFPTNFTLPTKLQPAAGFLVCTLIFIEYKSKKALNQAV
ncbi:sugar ABC transporter permease [Streptococcus pneumoniae]|nr:sugar ABC transporter permease [Streptococcus pneumoniae]